MQTHGVLAPVLLALAAYLGAEPPRQDFPALGHEVTTLVKERFYDPDRGERWAAENADYAAAVRDAETFRAETRRRLAQLRASHTEYYTPDDPGYRDLLSIFEPVLGRPASGGSLGFAAVAREGGWFVARVFAGGPAEAAGLRRGDLLVAADGEPFHPVRSLHGKAGRPVALSFRRDREGPSQTLSIAPRRIDPKQEWLQAQKQGSRVLERGGRRSGYVPLWSCAGVPAQETLVESLQDPPLAEAEALVLDLRGGWGGCNPDLMSLFDPAVPDLTRIDRQGGRSIWRSAWRKPLVALIDGGSRSGKEVVAHGLKKSRRAVLVGEPTAGAVMAGQPFLLADGSLLFLAVQDILVDGERLEGVGVTPDVAMPADLPYAAGRDPQLERALELALNGRP